MIKNIIINHKYYEVVIMKMNGLYINIKILILIKQPLYEYGKICSKLLKYNDFYPEFIHCKFRLECDNYDE